MLSLSQAFTPSQNKTQKKMNTLHYRKILFYKNQMICFLFYCKIKKHIYINTSSCYLFKRGSNNSKKIEFSSNLFKYSKVIESTSLANLSSRLPLLEK